MSLASYASDPSQSRGRKYAEEPSALRDAFDRDRDRIVHSAAFRRLKHKTQVFVMPDGDHYRTRLTHSLEVAQIGRVLARALGVHEGLTEAICLAHDLGHPPFGHEGEAALADAVREAGGFDHNGHTLRILTVLERSYARHPGLNLSWEVLEGLAKHNGPVESAGWALAEADREHDLDLATHSGLEAQVAAIADDIAYDNHDFEDGLRAQMFGLEAAIDVRFVRDNFRMVQQRYPDAPRDIVIAEMKRRQIGLMVEDVLAETRRRLADLNPRSVEDVRSAQRQIVAFSEGMYAEEREMKRFLYASMYHHPGAASAREAARATISEIHEEISRDPKRLPKEWERAMPADEPDRSRHIADFIAGMTDRFAQRFLHELQLTP
ncbi:deoxyguanosinetriphosphate triphosphohydrolase [Pacificimonas flava]|uniref:Deoxyguanosinetriphosphate triphosphohydrolase-like protein n=2 Tax=Pacificimonas TaxID=1960290 RepID=A0A219B161_9SPHN|nr:MULTISPECIES: deoxyguanosinetriphosphate triphosphohydrolase [Pacificimonas]MBZ6379683.1 deoxyguanosinetriphosphate triphosphohydrolase [Pacificimonas aurantium]OWV31856.1 deoxyguanosinetriphosphate triphosphohydrolase [Pacificimonas flava]